MDILGICYETLGLFICSLLDDFLWHYSGSREEGGAILVLPVGVDFIDHLRRMLLIITGGWEFWFPLTPPCLRAGRSASLLLPWWTTLTPQGSGGFLTTGGKWKSWLFTRPLTHDSVEGIGASWLQGGRSAGAMAPWGREGALYCPVVKKVPPPYFFFSDTTPIGGGDFPSGLMRVESRLLNSDFAGATVSSVMFGWSSTVIIFKFSVLPACYFPGPLYR